MAGVSETISPDQLESWFARLGKKLPDDWTPALKTCRLLLVAATKQNFAEAHGPDGSPWAAIKGFRARGGDRPLRDRGLLMASVTAAGAKGNVERLTPTSLVWGTNLEYAALQHEGGEIRPTSARALAVPWTREAYRAGSPRNFPGKLAVVWPRGRASGFLVESKAGRGKAQRGAKSIIHYFLLAKAVIPARPFLGWNAELEQECGEVLIDFALKKMTE